MTDERTGPPEVPSPPAPPAGPATGAADAGPAADAAAPRTRRPVVERVGMAAIAAVLAVLFAGVGAAAFVSGEPFLGVMGLIGAAMTAWVGGVTLLRG